MERTDSAAEGLDHVTHSAYGIERSWRGDLARVRYGRWEGTSFVALGAVTVRTWPDRLTAAALSGHLADAAMPACANGQAPDWRAIVAEVSARTDMISLQIVDVSEGVVPLQVLASELARLPEGTVVVGGRGQGHVVGARMGSHGTAEVEVLWHPSAARSWEPASSLRAATPSPSLERDLLEMLELVRVGRADAEAEEFLVSRGYARRGDNKRLMLTESGQQLWADRTNEYLRTHPRVRDQVRRGAKE